MNDAAVARHRPGTYARGEDTRRRLIETAIEAFGTYGYDGTSTRMLAEQADVTLPSIQYYFGSKEGLYRAAIEHIVGGMDERMSPVAARARHVLANSKAGRGELHAALGDLLDALIALIVAGHNSRKRFISRAEIERGAALAPVHDAMRRLVIEPCMGLVARLTGHRSDNKQVMIRALALVGQVSAFCHLGARHALGLAEFDDDQIRAIQSIVRQHTKVVLDAVAREAKP